MGELAIAGEKLVINKGEAGPVSKQLFDTITSIQRGTRPDVHNWMQRVV